MQLVVVGLNYRSAPLEIRERVSIGDHELKSALAQLKQSVQEGLIVSTCNRTEVYAVLSGEQWDSAHLIGFLAQRSGLAPEDLRHVTYVREGGAAARHALRVASGLDSMVLGEDQIQSQFKRAIAAARQVPALGPTLDRLGAAALGCGKRVRTFTGVGRHAVSIESLAVRAAERAGPLEERHVVVIGAGESATLVARQLRKAGVAGCRLTIVSRSSDRSVAVAMAADAKSGSLADLADHLSNADVVFACTSAPHPVVTPDFLAHRSATRPAAPLLCVDLGMPRDVHPDVRFVPGVSVVTLDELSTTADAHRAARRADIPAAELIVEREAARFLDWLTHRIARQLAHAPLPTLKRQTDQENFALG